jgi:hypothetical protein
MSVWDVNESGGGLDVFASIKKSHYIKLHAEMRKFQQGGIKNTQDFERNRFINFPKHELLTTYCSLTNKCTFIKLEKV